MEDYRARHGARGLAEGAYLFKVDMDYLYPFQYSTLDSDVQFEHGVEIDQWTIKYKNESSGEQAVVKVRYSERFNKVVEFEVELSEVPIKDGWGKDVTVNWRMFDGFDANKTFYTDSNGLEMQERRLNWNPSFEWNHDKQNISGNFYPVDSAIAIRDYSKLRQATVMNDRAQGGSADLTKGTIELIQQRRLLQDDNKGVVEILNETDSAGVGIKVTATYHLHIFDMAHGKSRQRQQQILNEAPLQYFFAFDTVQSKHGLA